MRILVIEDTPDMSANLVDYLEARGHVADAALDGVTGLHLAVVNRYDAILLDLMLPGMDGLTLCRRLREEERIHTPVLMLTARDALDDKIAGLEAGADDYVVKPFALREVEARLKALVRRAQGQVSRDSLRVHDLTFDTSTWMIRRADRVLDLPPIAARLLETLMRASPRVVSRNELEHAAWGDSPPDSDALRAHMHVLRGAVDAQDQSPLLRTVRGIGYQLVAPDADTQ